MEKQYLGDSVYVEIDGPDVILTTENGHEDDPRNRIVMEPEVRDAFVEYLERFLIRRKEIIDGNESNNQ